MWRKLLTDKDRFFLEKRTPQWFQWRQGLGMDSEAAAMLGISPFWPRTPEQLYAAKRLDRQSFETTAMRLGVEIESVDLESVAMEALERETGIDFDYSPLCVQKGRIGASLDGVSRNELHIAEVKAPCNGSESDLFAMANEGKLPEHYMVQVQHQIWCSSARVAFFGVYAHDSSQIRIVEISPNGIYMNRILDGWANWLEKADSGAFDAATSYASAELALTGMITGAK